MLSYRNMYISIIMETVTIELIKFNVTFLGE